MDYRLLGELLNPWQKVPTQDAAYRPYVRKKANYYYNPAKFKHSHTVPSIDLDNIAMCYVEGHAIARAVC